MSRFLLTLGDQDLILNDRYLKIRDTVILADLHLGKTMHFRKAGMPIPPEARDADQRNLMALMEKETPSTVIVLGDLFHSVSNSECDELAMITSQFPSVNFELVLGNHDILDPSIYRSIDFQTSQSKQIGQLILTHEPQLEVMAGQINLHGHIHPGIRLIGRGRQSMLFPCFYLSGQHFCLPAFGALTGLMKTKPAKGDRVFAILDGEVAQVF
jgi:uncharacterized protein